MNITTVTEFYNLINSSNLANTQPFNNLIGCMNQYNAICSCTDSSGKDRKYTECNTLYRALVISSIPGFVNQIKTVNRTNSLIFSLNGNVIVSY